MSVTSYGNPSASRYERSILLYWKMKNFTCRTAAPHRRNNDKLSMFLSVRYLDPRHVHVRMPSIACKRLKCNRG